jgi:hypothetical protein
MNAHAETGWCPTFKDFRFHYFEDTSVRVVQKRETRGENQKKRKTREEHHIAFSVTALLCFFSSLYAEFLATLMKTLKCLCRLTDHR